MSKLEHAGESSTAPPDGASCARTTHDVLERGAHPFDANERSEILLDDRRGLAVGEYGRAEGGERLGERGVRLALVTAAQQQHVRPPHPRERDARRRDIGRLRVVDPLDAAVRADGFHAVRQRAERPQPVGDARPRRGGGVLGTSDGHRERRGERVRDVVIAQQRELVARQQRLLEQHERVRHTIVVGRGRGRRGAEPERRARQRGRRAGNAAEESEHVGVVGVQHPTRRGGRVGEQQRLVGVVRIDRRVAVEVVGAQIRHDPDRRPDARRVVQLKR